MRQTKILSLSLPPELLREAEKISKKEGRTKSELFREALRRYIKEKEWQELQRYGQRQTARLDIEESDVHDLVKAYRKGK
jgi:CopG family transcriptional regulator / antitoxin EndoAI